MVSSNEEGAVCCLELRQRVNLCGKFMDTTVDEVASDGNEITLQAVHLIDDALKKCTLYRRPDVNITDLRNRKAMQALRQTVQPDIDLHDLGMPSGIEEPDHRQQQGRHRSRPCRRIFEHVESTAGQHGHGR